MVYYMHNVVQEIGLDDLQLYKSVRWVHGDKYTAKNKYTVH